MAAHPNSGRSENAHKVRDALTNALARLEARSQGGTDVKGKPTRITASSVCKEAGISRTTLYKGYPDVLELINDAVSSGKKPNRMRNVVSSKSWEARAKKLQDEVRKLLSENATLLIRAAAAESALEKHLKDRVSALPRQKK